MGLAMWLQILRYRGDGVIESCSNLFAPGYMITFPEFDSGHARRLIYRLSNVPQISQTFSPRSPYLYLCFQWKQSSIDSDWVKDTTTASIKLTVLKTAGGIAQSSEIRLSSMLWGETRNLHELWHYEKTKLHFDASTSYLLQIEYTPGTVPPPSPRLYLVVKDCAST